MKDEIEKSKEGFNAFLAEIPSLLEMLKNLLLKSKNYNGVSVNYDLDTILKVELFYIDVLKKNEPVTVSNNLIYKIMMAYYGEAFIHNAGGKWMFNDNKKDEDKVCNTPIIFEWGTGKNNMRISPVMMIDGIKKELSPAMASSIDYAANKDERDKELRDELMSLGKKKKKK